jgi:hypothetical protein
MKQFWRNNGLSIVMLGAFALFLVGQLFTGWSVHNQDLTEHGRAALSLAAYLLSGHFIEAVFENWESEFLQMSAYVVLTAYLFQKGSAESKAPGKFAHVDREPTMLERHSPRTPWPVRRGGWVMKLYEHSLALVLGLLFVGSWVLHAVGGARAACVEDQLHGQACQPLWDYIMSAQFWFESFQNWQSEFLAVAALIILSIWLRQKGSPESKPMAAPNDETGE